MTAPAKELDRTRHGATPPQTGAAMVSTRAVRPLLGYVRAKGHDSAAFLRDHDIDPVIFTDPDARLPHALSSRLWPAAAQLVGDRDLGLHVAEGIRPGSFGVLEYAVRTSENVGTGFERLFRYHRMLHDVAEVSLTVARDRAVLRHRLPPPHFLPREVSEYVLAAWLVTSRLATGKHWIPLQIRLPHAAPSDLSEHRRVFGCPLEFGSKCSELVFSRELLKLPMVKADADLQAILDAQVLAALEKLPRVEATTETVRRHLAAELCHGSPTLEQIAPRMNMSPRTLHRRLDEESTSFRQILTEVRRELATRHLSERRLAVGEIAFLLGFSEPSAFHRAFKRWTGHAPLNYRVQTHGAMLSA
jgi:AraC-like DNA-binding protein